MKSLQTYTTKFAALLLLAGYGGVSHAATISSDFSADADGWVISGDATSAVPTYLAVGGNPGGHIEADDSASGGIWYFQAPGKYLGELSGAHGELLQFDLKQVGGGGQISRPDLILNGGGIEIQLSTLENPLPVGEWVSYAVRLDDSEAWTESGGLASNAEILTVLSSLDRLRIRGEYINGADVGSLDNVSVTVVPVPGAVYLLGSSLLAVASYRKRRS